MSATHALVQIVHVVGAAILRGQQCLVARRSERMSDPLCWEFPGGKLEPGETPEQSLVRELREELAVDATIGALLGESEAMVRGRHLRLSLYLTELRRGEPRALEHDAVTWVREDELLRLAWAPLDVPLLGAVIQRLRGS